MAVIYHTPVDFTVYSGSEDAPDFVAANLLVPSVRRRFKAGGFGTVTLTMTFGSLIPNVIVCIQDIAADCIIESVLVGTGSGDIYITPPDAPMADAAGRHKLSFVVGPASFVEMDITPLGAEDVSIGAIFAMTESEDIPDALLSSETTVEWPQNLVELPNGNSIPVDRGPARTRLSLRYREPRGGDLERIARLARTGICWINMELDDTGQQYPVRFVRDFAARSLRAMQDEVSIELLEVA